MASTSSQHLKNRVAQVATSVAAAIHHHCSIMEEGGRAKRAVVTNGRGGVRVRSALQELAELRKSGGKRVDTYELKEEEAVYDEVDEADYAKLVQKRREEGGGCCPGSDQGFATHQGAVVGGRAARLGQLPPPPPTDGGACPGRMQAAL